MQRKGRAGCLIEMDVFGRVELDGEELTSALKERQDRKDAKINELQFKHQIRQKLNF